MWLCFLPLTLLSPPHVSFLGFRAEGLRLRCVRITWRAPCKASSLIGWVWSGAGDFAFLTCSLGPFLRTPTLVTWPAHSWPITALLQKVKAGWLQGHSGLVWVSVSSPSHAPRFTPADHVLPTLPGLPPSSIVQHGYHLRYMLLWAYLVDMCHRNEWFHALRSKACHISNFLEQLNLV